MVFLLTVMKWMWHLGLWFSRRQTCCFSVSHRFLSPSLSLSHTHKQEVHHCSAWVQVSSSFDLIDARSRRMSPLHVLRGLKCRLYKLQTRLKSCFRSESCGRLRTCVCVRGLWKYMGVWAIGDPDTTKKKKREKKTAFRCLPFLFPHVFLSHHQETIFHKKATPRLSVHLCCNSEKHPPDKLTHSSNDP